MTYDVAVVGLGAAGSATLWRLACRGVSAVGFDRFRPPHEFGSSLGRTRIIREAYWESPFYVPIVRRAYELWAELEAATGRTLIRATGGLVIGPPDGELVSGAIRSAEAHGVPFERLDAAAVRDRFPLRPTDDLAGVLEPRAGVLFPELAIAAMLGEAERAGATIHLEQPVAGWRRANGAIEVTAPDVTVRARALVLAAGAWMAGPLPGIQLPLQVARQPMFWTRPAPGQAFDPDRLPIWLWETTTPGGPVFYGFPDLGDGPKVARHHGGEITDPDRVRRDLAQGEEMELLRFLEVAIPGLASSISGGKVCLYTNTPDEHFILDRHPGDRDVILASPCSGHGFKFAPALGEALADLACGETPSVDLSPFRLDRFGGRTT